MFSTLCMNLTDDSNQTERIKIKCDIINPFNKADNTSKSSSKFNLIRLIGIFKEDLKKSPI